MSSPKAASPTDAVLQVRLTCSSCRGSVDGSEVKQKAISAIGNIAEPIRIAAAELGVKQSFVSIRMSCMVSAVQTGLINILSP